MLDTIELPRPEIMAGYDFAERIQQEIAVGEFATLRAMQFAPQPYLIDPSPVSSIVEDLLAAKSRGDDPGLYIDFAQMISHGMVGNRAWPRRLYHPDQDFKDELQLSLERTYGAVSKLMDAQILHDASSPISVAEQSTWLRRLGSVHILDGQSRNHAKSATIDVDSQTIAYVLTGNMTDSDLVQPRANGNFGMNNLAVRIVDPNLALFIKRATNGYYEGYKSGWIGLERDGIRVIYDIHNNGYPARRPETIETALRLIDPSRTNNIENVHSKEPDKPTHIVFTSPLPPDGEIRLKLEKANLDGVRVVAPRQPESDHRAGAPPFKQYADFNYGRLENSGVSCPERKLPTHIKSIMTITKEGKAYILCGSENYFVHLQKLLRIQELGVLITYDLKNTEHRESFKQNVNLMRSMGEIDDEVCEEMFDTANKFK